MQCTAVATPALCNAGQALLARYRLNASSEGDIHGVPRERRRLAASPDPFN